MKHVILDCGQSGLCILRVPNRVARNLRQYQAAFDEWLMDRNSPHPYWKWTEEDCGSFWYLDYDPPTAFAAWLNDNLPPALPKARLVARDVRRIYF